jgi:polysaccharide pyruvyl transferase WcaK-like protein
MSTPLSESRQKGANVTTGRSRPLRVVHVGIHDRLNRNAGDTLLFAAVRDLFERAVGPVSWTLRQVWEPLDAEEARELSDAHDAIIVGGGGLLLRDQAGSDTSRSGWQWNASAEAIESISCPLIVFAIGYNRFRGQEDFAEPFAENVAALARTAAFFGLRNTGSIRALGQYLPPELRKNLKLLPCPTTVLAQILGDRFAATDAGGPTLAVNVSFDRAAYRYGDSQDSILRDVARAIAAMQARGFAVRLMLHKEEDAKVLPWLEAANVECEPCSLHDREPGEIIDRYRDVSMSVGMRGHAQMIPFGLRIPIVSIVSHDKLAWFLEDLQRPEWGVDVRSGDLEARLTSALVTATSEDRRRDVAERQEAIWHLVEARMAEIARLLERRPAQQLAAGS